jgi:hypothetical protein
MDGPKSGSWHRLVGTCSGPVLIVMPMTRAKMINACMVFTPFLNNLKKIYALPGDMAACARISPVLPAKTML